MLLNPDTLPADVALPLALILVVLWVWMRARGIGDRRPSLDCLDGRHLACEASGGCACPQGCHEAQEQQQ